MLKQVQHDSDRRGFVHCHPELVSGSHFWFCTNNALRGYYAVRYALCALRIFMQGGEKMNRKSLIRIILSLSIVTMVACTGVAQQKPQEQGPEGKAPESIQVTFSGRVAYLESEGGYFIRGEHPYGQKYKIANQNPEVLEALRKTYKIAPRFEGRLTPGTNILFIEKINGQPYPGK
jgi:hypothetical protein